MLKKITLFAALTLGLLVAGILGVAATKPDTFQVERTITLKASPEEVYALLSDFHQWSAWSPWEKLDPAMKRTFSGAARDQGAVYAWEGNSEAGSGRMEITEATPPSKLVIKLDFTAPFEAHNLTEFTVAPEADALKVTWRMSGPQPFMSKVMAVFLDMDQLIGKDFETGLANLKALAEK